MNVVVGGGVADLVRKIWEKEVIGGVVGKVGSAVRRNWMNVGEWTLGEAVIGIKISINCKGVRGVRLDWVRCVDKSGMEMDCVLPWVVEEVLKEY